MPLIRGISESFTYPCFLRAGRSVLNACSPLPSSGMMLRISRVFKGTSRPHLRARSALCWRVALEPGPKKVYKKRPQVLSPHSSINYDTQEMSNEWIFSSVTLVCSQASFWQHSSNKNIFSINVFCHLGSRLHVLRMFKDTRVSSCVCTSVTIVGSRVSFLNSQVNKKSSP